MSLLRNLFGRRRSRFSNFPLFRRRQQHALTPKRGGIAMGTLLSLAAPFIVRKIQQRRAARAAY